MITLLDLIKNLQIIPSKLTLSINSQDDKTENLKDFDQVTIENKTYSINWTAIINPQTFDPVLTIRDFEYLFYLEDDTVHFVKLLKSHGLLRINSILSFPSRSNIQDIIIPIEEIRNSEDTVLYLTYGKFLSIDMTPYLTETINEDQNEWYNTIGFKIYKDIDVNDNQKFSDYNELHYNNCIESVSFSREELENKS